MLHRVAHRGYSAVAPENTLPAFAAATRAGATYVEFDVRTSADGVPVVIHDRTLERTTTGFGPVWEQPIDALLALDAGAWFSPAHTGVRIPTLTETLSLLAPAETALLLEIKPPTTLEQVKAIVEQVHDHGLESRTVVQSFDPDVIALVRSASPDLRRGLLRMSYADDTLDLALTLGVLTCNPPVADALTFPDTTATLRAANIDVMPWIANTPRDWPALTATGVTGLITDHVGELTGWCSA